MLIYEQVNRDVRDQVFLVPVPVWSRQFLFRAVPIVVTVNLPYFWSRSGPGSYFSSGPGPGSGPGSFFLVVPVPAAFFSYHDSTTN
jgi:hypothetical protein